MNCVLHKSVVVSFQILAWFSQTLCSLVTALPSVSLPDLLSSQTPLNAVQTEEKLAPPPVIQPDTEAEKQLIREVRPGGRWERGRQVRPSRRASAE